MPLPGKRVEHQGIKVQLIGQIELAAERNAVRANPHDFVSLGESPCARCTWGRFSGSNTWEAWHAGLWPSRALFFGILCCGAVYTD